MNVPHSNCEKSAAGPRQMAERVRIDRSFLADVERGNINISILNLELIADGLRVTLSQLLSRL